MIKEDVIEVVTNAVDEIESKTPPAELVRARVKMATWLWTKWKIAIKDMMINAKDGMPYLKVTFTNDEGKKEETYVSLEKYKERMAQELAGNFNASKTK